MSIIFGVLLSTDLKQVDLEGRYCSIELANSLHFFNLKLYINQHLLLMDEKHKQHKDHPVYKRIRASGPKRILALDGGGIRGDL